MEGGHATFFEDGFSVLAMSAEQRLAELELELPEPMAPVAAYRRGVQAGNLLAIAGQGPVRDGEIVHQGRLGEDLDVDEGRQAARLTGLNVLAAARASLGSLDRIQQVFQATVYVAADPGFQDHPAVADGATQLFEEILGEPGKPARAAVGVSSLPLGIPVEVETILEVAPEA